MAIMWKDGSILWSGGSIANSTACCCGSGGYPPPSSCAPCVNDSSVLTAPGAYLVEITGSTCDLDGSYILPYLQTNPQTCVYRYTFPSPIPVPGAADNFINLTLQVRYSGTDQLVVTANRDSVASPPQWTRTGLGLNDCDNYSATDIPSSNNPLACTEGTCTVTAL